MGCYQEGIAKDSVAGKDVTAHIFEFVQLRYQLMRTQKLIIFSQIHLKCGRYGDWRSFSRFLPGSDHLLFEGAEQEEAQ